MSEWKLEDLRKVYVSDVSVADALEGKVERLLVHSDGRSCGALKHHYGSVLSWHFYAEIPEVKTRLWTQEECQTWAYTVGYKDWQVKNAFWGEDSTIFHPSKIRYEIPENWRRRKYKHDTNTWGEWQKFEGTE